MMTFQIFENRLLEADEIFSAYHGRYEFNVSKAYKMISRKAISFDIVEYDVNMMHFLSHPDFNAADLNKVKSLKIDYATPIGLVVNFKDPESGMTEYMLIDGNHRTRKAVLDGKPGKYYLVNNPNDVKKFMKTDKKISHKLFLDDDE
jgi:hypothetical protein